MKKNILFALCGLLGIASLVGCSSSGGGTASNQSGSAQKKESETVTMNETEFDDLLSKQPLIITSTDYHVQDDQYKALYPDMLQVIIQNNSDADVKDAIIGFVAWDENNLPVKIKGQFDFTTDDYVSQVNYTDMNLVPGGTFGENYGYSLAEDNNINSFKAIIISFETFDGDSWSNPYYDAWKKMYEGVKYSDSLTTEVKVVDDSFSASSDGSASVSNAESDTNLTADELQAQIDAQPVKVTSTNYLVQDDQYKSLYPDMLCAVITNNSGTDVKDIVVSFVAWDANGLPVKIQGQYDLSGTYVKETNFDDANLVNGASSDPNKGYYLNEQCNNISTFKAIVKSYTDFDGKTWTNPLYNNWKSLYEGKTQS